MDEKDIKKHLRQLKSINPAEVWMAAEALGNLGDAAAVPALLEAIKGDHDYIRWKVARALEQIGDVSALPALLKDKHPFVRWFAVSLLNKIGNISVLPAFLESLKDSQYYVNEQAIQALYNLGDTGSLPRKVLTEPCLAPQQRIDVLEALRQIRSYRTNRKLWADLPEVQTFCERMLQEEDAEVCEGARAVLGWLQGKTLLRASQQDTTAAAQELLRASQGDSSDTQPETLLLPSSEPEATAAPLPEQLSFWQRLFRKPPNHLS